MPESGNRPYTELRGEQLANFPATEQEPINPNEIEQLSDESPVETKQRDIFHDYSIDKELQTTLTEILGDVAPGGRSIRKQVCSYLLELHGEPLKEKYELYVCEALGVLINPSANAEEVRQPNSTQMRWLLDQARFYLPHNTQITTANLFGSQILSRLITIKKRLQPILVRQQSGIATEIDNLKEIELQEFLEVVGSYYAALRNECSELPRVDIAETVLKGYYRKESQKIEAEQHQLAMRSLRLQKLLATYQRERSEANSQEAAREITMLDEAE